jgi:hypothetical protein
VIRDLNLDEVMKAETVAWLDHGKSKGTMLREEMEFTPPLSTSSLPQDDPFAITEGERCLLTQAAAQAEVGQRWTGDADFMHTQTADAEERAQDFAPEVFALEQVPPVLITIDDSSRVQRKKYHVSKEALEKKHSFGQLSKKDLQAKVANLFQNSQFAFEGKCWHEAHFEIVELTEVFRQKNPAPSRVLGNLRVGKVGKLSAICSTSAGETTKQSR